MTEDLRVGYIGLGAMGGALARRLLQSRPLHVHDRSETAMQALCEAGATRTDSAADLGRACDVAMICVPRSADVRAVVFGPGGLTEGLEPGKIVVDQTSGDPAETRRIARELAERGVLMADAPVSGGARGAAAGTIAIMAGGAPEVLDRLRPVFDDIGPNVTRCGGIGAGQAMKLVNNMISTCNRLAMLDGVTMGLKAGLDLDVMAEVLNAGGARSRATEVFLQKLAQGQPPSDFALDLMLKDLDLAVSLAQESRVPFQFGQLARGVLQAAVNSLDEGAKLEEIAGFVAAQAGTGFGPDR